MRKKYFSINWFCLILLGCANAPQQGETIFFQKEGATQDQFLKDRFSCYQETKNEVASAGRSESFGSYSRSTMPSCSAFMSCLAAKGYLPTEKNSGNLKVPKGVEVECN